MSQKSNTFTAEIQKPEPTFQIQNAKKTNANPKAREKK
jgi:hypothetical protein